MSNGKFVISLDFELYWGVRDAVKLQDYKAELAGVHEVIPLLLQLFKKYGINATFATVGFLFFNNKEELLNKLPDNKPKYQNDKLSPYTSPDMERTDQKEVPFYFAPTLIDQIIEAGQEIGSHTFSHYYCLEKGQTLETFKEDLAEAKMVAADKGIELKSLVFPRNQYNKDYIKVCQEMGFTSFRGNERLWLFSSENFGAQNFLRRPFRLLDSYINLSGHNCYSLLEIAGSFPYNIACSRFLRPYSSKMKSFENLRLKRIKESMTFAAKKGMVYHLWWHPHNFGKEIESNFSFLEKILRHYQKLNQELNFESVSMGQLSKELQNK
jgi:peptidoglycan/xylan/chitin deacetylase (PgdA/CDA1 family)